MHRLSGNPDVQSERTSIYAAFVEFWLRDLGAGERISTSHTPPIKVEASAHVMGTRSDTSIADAMRARQ